MENNNICVTCSYNNLHVPSVDYVSDQLNGFTKGVI